MEFNVIDRTHIDFFKRSRQDALLNDDALVTDFVKRTTDASGGLKQSEHEGRTISARTTTIPNSRYVEFCLTTSRACDEIDARAGRPAEIA